jgi:hypothetical protein
VDGGIRSATSLGVLRGTDVDEVYVLAPLASTEPDHPLQPHLRIERRIRQLITRAALPGQGARRGGQTRDDRDAGGRGTSPSWAPT